MSMELRPLHRRPQATCGLRLRLELQVPRNVTLDLLGQSLQTVLTVPGKDLGVANRAGVTLIQEGKGFKLPLLHRRRVIVVLPTRGLVGCCVTEDRTAVGP